MVIPRNMNNITWTYPAKREPAEKETPLGIRCAPAYIISIHQHRQSDEETPTCLARSREAHSLKPHGVVVEHGQIAYCDKEVAQADERGDLLFQKRRG